MWQSQAMSVVCDEFNGFKKYFCTYYIWLTLNYDSFQEDNHKWTYDHNSILDKWEKLKSYKYLVPNMKYYIVVRKIKTREKFKA